MPASTQTPYVDGWYGSERELTVVPAPHFPFANSLAPDTYSRSYDRLYQVIPRLFIPKIANRTSWTNLLLYSELFSNIAWTPSAVTLTDNALIAPDGNVTMTKLLETVANSAHLVEQDVTLPAAAIEVSIFATGGLGRNWLNLIVGDSASTFFTAFFNIASGYVGQLSAGVTAKIVPLGANQFRCVMRFTPAAGVGGFSAGISTDGIVNSYAGDVTKGLYLWGAQITAGVDTPYIGTTDAARTISAPNRDKIDPMAYLVQESDPNPQTSETQTAKRTFSRIPLDQVSGTTQPITKPNPSAFGVAGVLNLVSDNGTNTPLGASALYIDYLWGNNQVFGALKNCTSLITPPTGGTFTVTYKASTTAPIAYNAIGSVVAAAVNALADVISDGLTFSVGVGNFLSDGTAGFFVIAGSTIFPVTMDGTSLTPSAAQTIFNFNTSPTVKQSYVGARVSCHAHGVSTAIPLITNGEALNGPGDIANWAIWPHGSLWVVIDADTIALAGRGNLGVGGNQVTFLGQYYRDYTPGTDRVGVRLTQKFYLPGVTPGIATFADIPVPDPLLNDAAFLQSVIDNPTGYQVYDSTDLASWMNGPIYTQTLREINMADV